MVPFDYITPVYVGLAAVGGLYVSRMLQGSQGSLSWGQLASIYAVSAVGAVAAPMVAAQAICPHSPAAPFMEAGASAAVGFGGVYAFTGSTDAAARFVPVQAAAHLVGTWLASMHKTASEDSEGSSD